MASAIISALMDAELTFGCNVVAFVLGQIDIRVAAHPTIFDEVASDIAVINTVVVQAPLA